MTRKIVRPFLMITGLLFSMILMWHISAAQPLAKAQDIKPDFQGQFLAASDADMIATAYADGILNKENGIEDSLMCVQIENGIPIIKNKVHASHSVISWPAVLEWNPLKRYAYVAETRGTQDGKKNKMDDVYQEFPQGKRISVIDYSIADQPKIIQDTVVGINLQNVSINNNGTLLAAGSNEKGKELLIATLKDGLINMTYYFSEPEIDYANERDAGFRTVEFHPTKNIVGVNLNGKSVAFYEINLTQASVAIQKIGPTLEAGKKISVGNWHPSGKYFLVSDVGWGNGSAGFVLNGKGKLISIKFDENGGHQIASKVKVGLSPEGFDISPDGHYAITVNMRRTYLPKKFWFIPARKKASLSLVKIDANTGHLSRVGKAYGFKGALPEDAIFDAQSNSIAVAIYHKQDAEKPKYGWIDFWEIQKEQLVKTNTQLKVTRGVHNLLLIEE